MLPRSCRLRSTSPTRLTYNHSASSTLYDSLGASHVSTMYFRKDAVNSWEVFTYVDGTDVGGGADTLAFDSTGQLATINGAAASTTALPAYNPGNGAANLTLTLDLGELTQFGGGLRYQLADPGRLSHRPADLHRRR